MSICACGIDHAVERSRGTKASYAERAKRLGEPFEIGHPVGHHDPLELRATQTADGAWHATVFAPHWEEIPMCEVGSFEFIGLAATEARARRLARDAAASVVRKWERWAADRSNPADELDRLRTP